MSKTMKTAVVRALGQPLLIEEVVVPMPQAGQILVKIEGAGFATQTCTLFREIGRSS